MLTPCDSSASEDLLLTGEVLRLVLERLDVTSRCAAACVCHDWCSEVAKTGWRYLYIPPRFTDEQLARAVAKSVSKLHSFRLDGCMDVPIDGFEKALCPRSAPLLRELVIVNGSRLNASTLDTTLSRGSLKLLSIRGLFCGSIPSMASVRALLAPGGVLDVARACNAPAQLTQANTAGGWMRRCRRLRAASDDDDALLCDVFRVTYCPACVALMEERNGWVSKTCDGRRWDGARCTSIVCSRCIFTKMHGGDDDDDLYAASCANCEIIDWKDGLDWEANGEDAVCNKYLCTMCADEFYFCHGCEKCMCGSCKDGIPGCDMICCSGKLCSLCFCEECAPVAYENDELFDVWSDEEGEEGSSYCKECMEELRAEAAA